MKKLSFLIITCLFSLSCSSGRSIDREQFKNLYGAAKRLEKCTLDTSLPIIKECEEDLAIECGIAATKVSTHADKCFVYKICYARRSWWHAITWIEAENDLRNTFTLKNEDFLYWSEEKERDISIFHQNSISDYREADNGLKEALEWFLKGKVGEESMIEWPESWLDEIIDTGGLTLND